MTRRDRKFPQYLHIPDCSFGQNLPKASGGPHLLEVPAVDPLQDSWCQHSKGSVVRSHSLFRRKSSLRHLNRHSYQRHIWRAHFQRQGLPSKSTHLLPNGLPAKCILLVSLLIRFLA